MSVILRDYQKTAVDAVVSEYRKGRRRTMAVLPTGAGKTIIFGSVARYCTDIGQRVLVLAHTEELIDQAANTLKILLPDVTVGMVRAHHDECDAMVVVATVQTLRSPERLARIGTFSLIVIDEAHHAAAATYRMILETLGAFSDSGPRTLGVTATPDRGDGQGLDDVFESVAFDIGVIDLMRAGYLAPVRAKRVMLDVNLDGVGRRNGDFADGALGEALVDAGAPQHIALALHEHAEGRKSVVFVPTVAMAEETAAAIMASGLRATAVSGQTPKEERRAIISAIRDGELDAVTNAMVLTEGFDAPVLDCAVMARPTSSRSLYQQSAGRVLRRSPGKDDALILDFVGVTRHKLQTAASLAGMPDSATVLEDELLTDAVDRLTGEPELADDSVGNLVAFDIDLFDQSNLHWIPLGHGSFLLSSGDRLFAIKPDDEGTVTLVRLVREGYGHRAVPMASHVSAELAQGLAEGEALSGGFNPIALRNQGWRSNPVSEPQKRKLWVLGIRGKALARIETAGEASDLIAAAEAQQSLSTLFIGREAA